MYSEPLSPKDAHISTLTDSEAAPVKRFSFKRFLLAAVGVFFVILGGIGVLLPILPTTPFLLVASLCFAGSSPRLYRRLLNAKYFGEFIRNYQEGVGVRREVKRRAIFFLWLMLIVSACLVRIPYVCGILLLVGVGVTIHIATIKPRRRRCPAPSEACATEKTVDKTSTM